MNARKKIPVRLFVLSMMLLASALFFVVQTRVAHAAPSWWTFSDSSHQHCDSGHYGNSYHLETTWNGLEVCGYGALQPGGSDVEVTFPGNHGEYEWECVELVKRYLYMAYGAQAIDAYGYNLVNNYTSTYSSLFTKVANDGTHHIKVGDVLSYNEVVTGDHGHTAIVTSLSLDGNGTGTITVVEENADTSGQHTQTVTNWVIKHGIDDGGTTDTVSNWLTPNQAWTNDTPSGTSSDYLYAVSATGTTNVMATGYEVVSGQGKMPLVWRYNSTGWHKDLPTPVDSYKNHWLYGMATYSSTDAWIVGTIASNGGQQTLAYHYNGSSWWNAPSDNNTVSGSVNVLESVAYAGSSNYFTVGYTWDITNGYQPILEKWVSQGKFALQSISLPSGYTSGYLYGVSFASSTDGWAVGQAGYYSSGWHWNDVYFHYNGSSWTSQIGSLDGGKLLSVVAISSSEYWAVGTYGSGTPLIMHYSSGSWTQDTSFSGYPTGATTLYSVSADSSSDVWALGSGFSLRYMGTNWALFNMPTSSLASNGIAVASGDAWAVGSTDINMYS